MAPSGGGRPLPPPIPPASSDDEADYVNPDDGEDSDRNKVSIQLIGQGCAN